MDEIARLRSLLDMYEAVLDELRRETTPETDELVARLECRAAIAAYEYYELLHPAGARNVAETMPRRTFSYG